MIRNKGIHCIHVSAPIGGTALAVLSAALSGDPVHVQAAHEKPISLQLLAPSSMKKYLYFSSSPERLAQTELQKRVLSGQIPNLNLEFTAPKDRKKDWRLFTKEQVRQIFEMGACYTHEQNNAGHAVLKRLTARDMDLQIQKGWYLRCFLYSKRFPVRIQPSEIVLDQPDFCVVDKPRGLPSIATNDNYVENALYQTSQILGQPLWSVHRLDHPTSGCLIFAKTQKACREFNKTWSTNTRKFYSLVAQAEQQNPNDLPPPGTKVTHWMNASGRGVPKPISNVPIPEKGIDKECSLIMQSWERTSDNNNQNLPRAFAKVEILTGRTHQIRTQFAQLGWPLQHDILYRAGFDRQECETNGVDFFCPDQLVLRCYRIMFNYKGQEFDIQLNTGIEY